MKQKVLITGASGFVGFHLIEAALKAGLEVHAAVRSSSRIDHLQGYEVQYVSPDFSNAASIREVLEDKQYDYVIHAAGITKAFSDEEYNAVNAGYTKALAMAVKSAATPLKKFVFISSLAALGPIAYDAVTPICENSEPKPVTGYGRSKLLAEQYLQQIEGLPLITLRPTAVYGPRDKDIFIMFKLISRGFEPYIGRKQQRFSFLYVKDLAKATIEALTSPSTGTYNLSDGNVYDRYALADVAKRLLGRQTWKVHIPFGIVQVIASTLERMPSRGKTAPALNREKLNELTAPNWYCSIEKSRTELHFSPDYDLEKGLAETLQWYRDNKWL
ncbi:NAD(P)-dependent oxidoreductase [uncultured Chitinophaga sp.]|uniref:NAD-dependent epimerase/dehydratase family protein n=1 Tax=uncultured Chitinophaga sp. TaxID=339340 RepID=UPI00260EF1D0|nr:NAD(P)-dependent oxidoreductase [uncultured Chitinophaga sp.]